MFLLLQIAFTVCIYAGYIQTKDYAELRTHVRKKDWHRTASAIGPSDHVVMISVSQVRPDLCAVERVEIDVMEVDGSARLVATICVGHGPTIEVYRSHVFHVHWKMNDDMVGVSFGFRVRFSYHKVCVL